MLKMNYLAVIVAATAAFVVGPVWYSPLLFGDEWMTLRGMDSAAMAELTPPLRVLIAEFVRVFVVAYVLARFVVLIGVVDGKGAVQLGLWVWLGFQAILLVGSVLHENYPWELFAIHAGDALVKTLLMTVILGVWRQRASSVKEGV